MDSVELIDPLQTLSADYLSLFASGNAFSDVTFCIDGRQVHAHRCILAARCPFFRLMLSCAHDQASSEAVGGQLMGNVVIASAAAAAGRPPNPSLVIPVDVVGYDVFITLLHFLYSGQLIVAETQLQAGSPINASRCPHRACSHSNCNHCIDLFLELIHAAKFFGVDQLSDLVQAKLASALEGVSVENLMRVLVVAKRQKLHHLWDICSELVLNTGLGCEVLRTYLPTEILSELADARLQTGYVLSMSSNNSNVPPQIINNTSSNVLCSEEQRILRLQQALDCMDVELVRLMVMGEGLNLDKAQALHYSVANCDREVVKALLELGVVDVNYGNGIGRTALHLAAEMGNAEMIAVLLDHHADPNVQTEDGITALDIVRCLIKAANHEPLPLCKADQKRIHLCIELLQSAVAVAAREEAAESSSCVTQGAQMISDQINETAGLIPQALIRDDRLTASIDHYRTNATRISVNNHAEVAGGLINPPVAHHRINYGYLFSGAYAELIHNVPAVTNTDHQQEKSTSHHSLLPKL